MNRLYFYLAGCSMMFGDMVFLAAFVLTSWVEVETTVVHTMPDDGTTVDFKDGEVVDYGLWRTCVHQDGRTTCSGVKLSPTAASMMCISLAGLLGSAILYIILWLKIHKYLVLGTIFLHLLAGVMCSIALALVAVRKRDLATHDSEGDGDISKLSIGFWLATSSTVITFLTTFLICISIFIREPFPANIEEQPAPPPQEADRNRPRVRPRNPGRNLSSRNSMVSDSQTDFSSSSFGSASALPSIGTSSLPSSSLREAAGMSVSDFDIRARTAVVNLAVDFPEELPDGIRTEEIDLHSMESLNQSSNPVPPSSEQTTNTTNTTALSSSTSSGASPNGAVGMRYTKSGDVYTGSATSEQTSDDECTVDRVMMEDFQSREFTRSDLSLTRYERRAARERTRRATTSPR